MLYPILVKYDAYCHDSENNLVNAFIKIRPIIIIILITYFIEICLPSVAA